jgi:hypothetical protein
VIRSLVCYIDFVVVLRKFTLDIGICASLPSPCAVCLFFKLDQYQEILMSISTTQIIKKTLERSELAAGVRGSVQTHQNLKGKTIR